jgi:hypothetical protein
VQPVITLPVAIDEDAVRRLCGSAVFAQADALQRAGHVLAPKIGENVLVANVRGTWNRIDEVAIRVQAGRFHPECTRDGAAFCRHVGALLLHWVRAPETFALVTPATAVVSTADGPWLAAVALGEESTVDEIEQLLQQDTVPRMREVANRRGVRGLGSKKADVVHNLAIALADPSGIDATLTALTDDERLALDAVHLVSAQHPAPTGAIRDAFHVLGGHGKPRVDALRSHGLILVSHPDPYNQSTFSYVVPRAVAAQLAPRETLVNPAREPKKTGDATWLGMIEMMQFITLESTVAPFAVRSETAYPALGAYGRIPAGFTFEPGEAEMMLNQIRQHGYQSQAQGVVLAAHPLLADDALERLVARTGQPSAAIDFVMRLMLMLDVAQATPLVVVQADRMQTLLDLEPAARLAVLVDAWLGSVGSRELSALVRSDDRLQARWHATYAGWGEALTSLINSIARLLVRIIARVTTGRWFDLQSLIETVERLAPASAPVLGQPYAFAAHTQAFSLERTMNRADPQPIVPNTPEGLTHLLSRLVAVLVDGPLHWLGLVDAIIHQDRTGVFRVRPIAGALTGRAFTEEPDGEAAYLAIEDDLTIRVPPHMSDVSIHSLLAFAGELVEAAPDGLRYRLTASGVQQLFDTGYTGPDFAHYLFERAGNMLPDAVRATIDRWWQQYGTIRLYDELTLIELSDDVLLKELRAVTALDSAQLYAFSPRLIAIDPAHANEVVAELTARGYTPRLVEDG